MKYIFTIIISIMIFNIHFIQSGSDSNSKKTSGSDKQNSSQTSSEKEKLIERNTTCIDRLFENLDVATPECCPCCIVPACLAALFFQK